MRRKAEDFEAIIDWSPEGRRRLVEERGPEIRLLLDQAFSDYADRRELGWYGFRDSDPVAQAVEWALERFATLPELDPGKLGAGLRGFGLFVCPSWWLAQKVGKVGFRARSTRTVRDMQGTEVDPDVDSAEQVLDRFAQRLGGTLKDLRDRTCDDLVGFWLEATEGWRRDWFGWRESAASSVGDGLSSKTRSFRAHDATFRFALLFRDGLVYQSLPHEVVNATMLSPCANEAPYRVPDRDVAEALATRVSGAREVGRLRKAGAASLVLALCAFLACRPEEPVAQLEWTILRRSISPTTLHALDIEGTPGLCEAVTALPSQKGDDHAQ
jgi:hypothetical protein